jgi:hypothetical protein
MIIWILGGTAVGKKTYIRHLAAQGFGEPCWMEDDDQRLAWLAGQASVGVNLARWQWAREHVIADIAKHFPQVQQRLCLLTADHPVQMARANKREPDKWGEENLQREAQQIRYLALGLAKAHGLPLLEVDISPDDMDEWRPPA